MKSFMIFLVSLLVCPCLLNAQWSSNPAENTLIVDTIGGQVLPKIAVNPETGGSYISWFSEFGDLNFDVLLQRLDANGNKLWDTDGILISDHPTNTWVTDYDLVIDNDGYAVLVNQDYRTGTSNVFAYRISPDGEFIWGNDGIALSNNTDFNPSPRAVVTQDGNIVFVWDSDPEDENSFANIHVQKLSPDGDFLWSSDVIISNDTMDCYMPYFRTLFQSEDNSTVVVWLETIFKDTVAMPGDWPNMHPFAQKIDADGNFVWPEKVALNTLENMPLKPFMPSMVSDGNGGCYIAWMAFPDLGDYYTTYVQHVNSDGETQWTPNGVNVSDSIQFEHTAPAITYLPQNDELFVFWNEWRRYSATNVQCAIFGQKFSSTGERQWTTQGQIFDGWYSWFDTATYISGLCPATDDDFTLFFEKEYFELSPDTLMITNYHATRINREGNYAWDIEKPFVSSANSNKYNFVASKLVSNQWIVVWSDNRKDPEQEMATGIYAQNLSIDGHTGITGVHDQHFKPGETILNNYPNPFSYATTISYQVVEAGQVDISLFNEQGHYVKKLFGGVQLPGEHSIKINSRHLSPGMYVYRLTMDNQVAYGKMVIVK